MPIFESGKTSNILFAMRAEKVENALAEVRAIRKHPRKNSITWRAREAVK